MEPAKREQEINEDLFFRKYVNGDENEGETKGCVNKLTLFIKNQIK